ncbi:hypothetical protein [Mycoplasmopsis bovis]|uniref:hypothetical protein n=1 Tax=Mycoplasmopsis bovis TaxID=28903 RepID=UPI003D2A6C50
MNAFRNNKENVLLEFTATCDLLDKNVLSKYKDKIVFNYPLFDFSYKCLLWKTIPHQ